jgi:hypothetical protein
MNSRGGKLDNGTGQLTENAVNCTINAVDTLEKRNGFIRGFNERFGSVVCGLHTYIDNCGAEWMIVVSDEEMAIRQPFFVPVFTNDDSYPLDDFSDVAGLSEDNWRNTSPYTASGGSLQRSSGEATDPINQFAFLRWFKGASSPSYQVTIQYDFDASSLDLQIAAIVIKGNGDLQTGRRLQAEVVFQNGVKNTFRLWIADSTGTLTLIREQEWHGSFDDIGGFMTVSYTRTFDGATPVFRVDLTVTPTGGGPQLIATDDITELMDSEFGQISAIACTPIAAILQVTGGPV